MIFDEYFDRIVILSLDPQGDRARATVKDLAQKNLGLGPALVRAYRGEEMPPPAWFKASAEAWGCLKSHIRVLEDALRDGVKRLLILEDDCVWLPNAARLAVEFLAEVPKDWGQIYFGGQLRPEFPSEPIEGKIACLRAKSVHRTHAYAVSRPTMPRLLQHIQDAPDYIKEAARAKGKKRHLDHQMEVAHRRGDWPVYLPSYWLAGQAENHSVVLGRDEFERWWQLRPARPEFYIPLVVADVTPTPGQRRMLHFGRRLSPADPTIDVDVEQAKGKAPLVRIMKVVAQEALVDRRVPAFHAWKEKCALLEKHWPAGVLNLSDAPDLSALGQTVSYPHPWLNPRLPCEMLAAGAAYLAEVGAKNILDLRGDSEMALAYPARAKVVEVVSDVEVWLLTHEITCDVLVLNDVLEGIANNRAGRIVRSIRNGKWNNLIARTTPGFRNAARGRIRPRERVPIDVAKLMRRAPSRILHEHLAVWDR